jgi:NAD(P)-dependent dehydrogenase (short-subunit alcohol dehydrogenase family)
MPRPVRAPAPSCLGLAAMLVLNDIKSADVAKQTPDPWRISSSSHVYPRADTPRADQVEAVVNAAFEKFPGTVTVLGHARGCGLRAFAAAPEAEFERISRFHFFAPPYLACWVWARRMKRKISGHSIFISRYVGRMPHRQISSCLAAKAGLENFARNVALEYATRGVRVNVISPGNGAAGSSPKAFEEDRKDREFVPRVSPGKRNLPESIADAFVFLCSPLANQIKGQVPSSDVGAGIGSGL